MGTRSSIFSTKTPGLPVNILDVGTTPGSVFFVNSSTGTNGAGYGSSPDSPVATIDYAVGLCTANKGDVIYVMPGHNESLTTANGVDADVAGISIIGLGTGSLKPTLDYDHADGEFVIGADNVTIKNLRFRVSANAVTKAIDIEAGADSYVIDGCEFGWAETASDEFTDTIIVNVGCNDGIIQNCLFAAGAQAAVTGIKLVGASDNIIIRNNRFTGAYSTAMINGITTLSTNLLIDNNVMQQGATEPGIELLTGTTGVIKHNYIATNLATIAASIVADGCWKFLNYYCEVGNETGAQIGTASVDD